ncbi:glycosyl hydrolase family 71-domain-containing protein [Aspergillus crustosus]
MPAPACEAHRTNVDADADAEMEVEVEVTPIATAAYLLSHNLACAKHANRSSRLCWLRLLDAMTDAIRKHQVNARNKRQENESDALAEIRSLPDRFQLPAEMAYRACVTDCIQMGDMESALLTIGAFALNFRDDFMAGSLSNTRKWKAWGIEDVEHTFDAFLSTWKADIQAAQQSHIDAFVLNLGFGIPYTARALTHAFSAAASLDFKLLFSFDYAGSNSTHEIWPKQDVIDLLEKYTTHNAYFQHNGEPLVSTFEGFGAAKTWAEIKRHPDLAEFVFIPNWTSVGPTEAAKPAVVDGLMCWNAWPDGARDMNTTDDEAYMSLLKEKPYIMAVSPWFFTNLQHFNKSWVWRGDDLWYDRWQQILLLDPEFVEILTWNDYGESHYIGPVHEEAETALRAAGAPYDYVDGRPHDAWRLLLPYLIEQYKADGDEQEKTEKRAAVEVEEELLTVWYRLSPARACSAGNVTGNTESHSQALVDPGAVLEDRIFYSALLEEPADVSVSIGGDNRTAAFTDTPEQGTKGIYHGSVSIGESEGGVVVILTRNGELLAQMQGANIESQKECPRNQTNWNAWVGNATAVKLDSGVEGLLVPVRSWTVWAVMASVIMIELLT